MLDHVCSKLRNVQKSCLAAFIALGYLNYYIVKVVKPPFLAASAGPFKSFLLENMPILQTAYWPTFWCVEGRIHTLLSCFIRRFSFPNINYRREILKLNDGGEVALDWLENKCKNNSPIVIILPGITGQSQVQYIKCLVVAANNIGIRTVVFNNRGKGGIPLKTARSYCSANSEDLKEVLNHIKANNPNVKIGATGISLGAMMLGNYLANFSDEAKTVLTAVKMISAPWDIKEANISIEKPIINSLMDRYIARSLCESLRQNDILQKTNIDLDYICSSKTILEYDSRFTLIQFGYSSIEEYFKAVSLVGKLHKITVPVLGLSAADDPFQPSQAIPIEEAEKSSHVAIVVTSRGGHIGFLDGWWPTSVDDQYMSKLFIEYFTVTLLRDDTNFNNISEQMLNLHQAKAKSWFNLDMINKNSSIPK